MNQSERAIAQIQAYDLIKLWQRKYEGWGHLGVFGVIGGQNAKISEPRQIIYQNEALGHVITKKGFVQQFPRAKREA